MRKKRIFKRGAAAVLGLFLTAGTASCGLIPVEESFPAAPYFVEEEPGEYTTAVCLNGDVVLTTTLDLKSVPKRKEDLSFDVSGEHFDAFFVTAGQAVTEGDLLGQLNILSFERELTDLTRQQEELELRLRQNEENRQAEIERNKVVNADSYTERMNALTRINNRYDENRLQIENSISVCGLRIDACHEEIKKRQIYAPFTGVLTYVSTFTPEDVSSTGKRVMTIADSTTALFRASTMNWEYFTAGLEIPLTIDDVEYVGIVETEESLGIEHTKHVAGEHGYVYISLQAPAFDTSDSKTVRTEVELERKENCLSVPNNAITTINDESVVYYPDEEGVKRFRKVETGLQGTSVTEILSGLEEGDLVIID